MASYVKKKQEVLLTTEEVKSIIEQIETNRFTKSWRTNRQHKAYLKDKHANKSSKLAIKQEDSSVIKQEAETSETSNATKSANVSEVKALAKAEKRYHWSGQVEQDDLSTMPFTSKNAVFMTPFEVIEPMQDEPATIKTQLIKLTTAEQAVTNIMTPSCPKCSSEMIQRVAKKGARQGQTFFGCSQFPKCRGVVNGVAIINDCSP